MLLLAFFLALERFFTLVIPIKVHSLARQSSHWACNSSKVFNTFYSTQLIQEKYVLQKHSWVFPILSQLPFFFYPLKYPL